MIFRIMLGLIIFWMTTASLLPFFGVNFVLLRGAVFEPFLIDESNTYLHIIRSSTFASMAFFGVNYLRRKRPLSSVAPLLVFVCFLVIYAPVYLFIRGDSQWWEWATFAFMIALAVIFFRENQAEAKKIFLSAW